MKSFNISDTKLTQNEEQNNKHDSGYQALENKALPEDWQIENGGEDKTRRYNQTQHRHCRHDHSGVPDQQKATQNDADKRCTQGRQGSTERIEYRNENAVADHM